MIPRVCVSALVAAVAASAHVARGVCNADNCLRALRAASPTTRLAQAQEDCAAWLVATVTPPAETATVYSTISSTETIVEEVTLTNSIHDTFTSTIRETPTETVYTSTETVTVNGNQVTLKKRAAAPTIPTYASACSGAVRFSSACSCIGVSAAPSTVTLPANTVTVTEPTAVWATATETSVVATSSVVIYDQTITETVTEPAVTVSTVATVTTTQVVSPTSTFTVAVEGDNLSPGFFGRYLAGTLDYGLYTTDSSEAITLTLRPDGSLWYGAKVAKGDVNGNALGFFFIDPSISTTRRAYKCAVDASSTLTCQVGTAGNDRMAIQTSATTRIIYNGKPQNMQPPNFIPLTLRVSYL